MFKFISSPQSWLVKLLYSTLSEILTEFSTVFKENIVIHVAFSTYFLNVVGKQHVDFISDIDVFCLILPKLKQQKYESFKRKL